MLNFSSQMLVLALYVGPDQLMPLASLIGLIGGAVMMGWRRFVGLARRVQALFSKR